MRNPTTLPAEQRISRAVAHIMNDNRFRMLAGMFMIGRREVVDEIPTACTNGRDEFYGRKFVETLSDAEVRFLVLHEMYHKMYRHMVTWRHLAEENAKLANCAMDFVINIQLVDADPDGTFIAMPKVGLLDEKYRGWDTARVYADIKKNGHPQVSEGSGLDEHDWASAEEMTEQEKRDLHEAVTRAIQQGALQAAKTGANVDRDLLDLTRPQVDWRDVLRQFIKNLTSGRDYSTWARPNRRFVGAGYYMPSSISESVGDIVVGVDTSGSISSRELSAFLSEVQGICTEVKPANVHLVYWGHDIAAVEDYPQGTQDTLVDSTRPVGGGGTDVNCLAKHIRDNNMTPEAVIVLTDGYLYDGWGTWNAPVLWGIIDNKHAVPTVGTALHIEKDMRA